MVTKDAREIEDQVSKKKKILICSLTVLLLLGLIIVGCRGVMQPDLHTPDDHQPPDNDDNTSSPNGEYENGSLEDVDTAENDFRAVWVPSVINLDFPSRQGLSAESLKREIDSIVNRSAEIGLNAIIFQVRPTGDAFYESKIFPWSHWLSGTQGEGIPGFDPLAYWIEAAHAQNIELHAWLNPYRIIHTVTNSSDPSTLSPENPVYQRPELAVRWTDRNGRQGLFLDPGLPEARQLIIDGISEILVGYNIDGIHIDDYFYPGTNFDDAVTFERYGNGMDLDDWRRENVNTLIQEIQVTIRGHNEYHGTNVRWGISPSAIWKNNGIDPLGVPVPSTFESYNLLYADTRRWVLEEWVDYINPQIYWYIGFETADFEAILDWWVELCMDTDVDLYVGHAAYREFERDQPPHWEGEMIRQLEMTNDIETVKGNVFYRFQSIQGALGNSIRDFFRLNDGSAERRPVMILDTLSVGMPVRDVVFTATADNAPGYNIVGTSLSDRPLYLNGEEVTNRTIEGFFFVFVPLETGENVFTFSQEGQEDVVRLITRNAPTGGGGGGGAGTVTVTQITTPRYATIVTDEAWLFPSHTTTGGSDWLLSRGQQDRVVAESSNNFVRLSSGAWVADSNVTLRTENAQIVNVLKDGIYRSGEYLDKLVWQSEISPVINPKFDGNVLTINFGMHTELPPLNLPENLSQTVFSSYSNGVADGIPFYEFIIRNDVNFEGYFVEFIDGEFRFSLKKRKTLAQGDRPLTDITIVLDPGHGGDYSGAIGPLGMVMPEKYLALINTLKLAERLEALGAKVHLTRDTDITVSLQDRVNLSYQVKPDLFISLHINSVAETTNATNIRGFTVWYRNPNSVDIAQSMLDVMHYINPATNRHRGLVQFNLFVCRPSWVPSVLLEAGFIINIDDFVWMIDSVNQDKMADATVQAILEYFAR